MIGPESRERAGTDEYEIGKQLSERISRFTQGVESLSIPLHVLGKPSATGQDSGGMVEGGNRSHRFHWGVTHEASLSRTSRHAQRRRLDAAARIVTRLYAYSLSSRPKGRFF
jgi:hypothetical protein